MTTPERPRLVEGSEIRVNCVGCGERQFAITVMLGQQNIRCPSCGNYNRYTFTADRDGYVHLQAS